MALEWGRECFCGSKRDDYDQYGKSKNCDMKCPGDRGSACGGSLAMSVFRI